MGAILRSVQQHKDTHKHRAMSLEGRSWEKNNLNTTARQAKSKVKKGAAIRTTTSATSLIK
jgi:hypothetical protein